MKPDFLKFPIALSLLGACLLFQPVPEAVTLATPRAQEAGTAITVEPLRSRLRLGTSLTLALRPGQRLELPYDGASSPMILPVNGLEIVPGSLPGSPTVLTFHSTDPAHKLVLRGHEIAAPESSPGACASTRFKIDSGDRLELVGLGPRFAPAPLFRDRIDGLVISLSDCLTIEYGELGQTELVMLSKNP